MKLVAWCAVIAAVCRWSQPLAAQPGSAARGSARSGRPAGVLCLRDGVSGAPLVGARVRVGDAAVVWSDACAPVAAKVDTLFITRVGYRGMRVPLALVSAAGPATDTLHVALWPLDAARRATVRPAASAMRMASDTARLAAVAVQGLAAAAIAPTTLVRASDARERGVASTAGLLALLPFTTLRSARGETALSLRGARREQVVVTLDGLPLNDPATGMADVADLPLAALASAHAVPGADPLGAGSGASGGVIALTSARQRLLSAHHGAFGLFELAGATTATWAGARAHATGSYRTARNDFAFRNDVAPTPQVETRVNNDERRLATEAGVVAARWQASVLASHGERGMVGAINVRAYDADRATTTRVALRTQAALGSTLAVFGARTFALHYADPTRPTLDVRARAHALDLDWRGAIETWQVGALRWRAGGGADALRSGRITQDRHRGFGAVEWRREGAIDSPGGGWRGGLGVRVDAVERSGVLPTGSADITWRLPTRPGRQVVDLTTRLAQAVRVPTLYDLYFTSPQRLSVRALAPERVVADASLGVTSVSTLGGARVEADVQWVARDTRDAIVWFPGNFGWSPDNVGRERLRGVEARAAYTRPTVTVSSWATRYTSTLVTGGLSIPTPYVPTMQGGAQLRLAPAWLRGVVWTAAARVQGRRPFSAGPRNAAFELPAIALLDVAAARRWHARGASLLATVAIDNATDRAWQSVRGFPMPGRTWTAGITFTPAASDTPR